MKKQTGRQPSRNREEISDNFAICVCILILLAMGLVLLLGGCGGRGEVLLSEPFMGNIP